MLGSMLRMALCTHKDHVYALQAAQFCRGAEFVSAQQTTVSSGIADLLLGADIDEFVFEPCGYSMNGLQVRSHPPATHVASQA